MSLSPIQNEIKRALVAMGGRSKFTDAQLAKKLRELCRIDGKKKAVLALADVLAAMESLGEAGALGEPGALCEPGGAGAEVARGALVSAGEAEVSPRYYDITVTSANDLLIERCAEPKDSVIELEARQRRQRHEKSLILFTNGDVGSQADGGLVANGGRRNRGYHRGEKRAGRGQRTERMSLNVNRDYSDSE